MNLLSQKVAFITGAGQGLGAGTAQALARDGAAVCVADINLDKAAGVAASIEASGSRAVAVHCDVRDRESVDRAVAEVITQLGRLDILVNNAMSQRLVPFESASTEDLLEAYRTSVLGTFNCMQAGFTFLKSRGGSVVNFGSNAGTQGVSGMSTYGAAKEGVGGLSRAVAAEWGKLNITVNVVVPNGASPAWEALKARTSPEDVEVLLDRPIRRMGDPVDDVGRVVTFLASPYAGYITGRTIFVDGGKGRLS